MWKGDPSYFIRRFLFDRPLELSPSFSLAGKRGSRCFKETISGSALIVP